MKRNLNNASGYMSVGEIAEKAGVTVRTLQYYDQSGLLSPSAKGARNQRLYTENDLEKLYRILCYKFMGLKLEEIRSQLDRSDNEEYFRGALQQQINEAETAISQQMRRYAVLKDLESINGKSKDTTWEDYAGMIDYIQNKWDMIWNLNDAIVNDPEDSDMLGDSSEETKRYYKLISDAVKLKKQGVPPEDDAAVELIGEYFRLRDMNISNGTWDHKQEIIKIEPDNIRITFNEIADFLSDIKEYLKKASEQYYKVQEADK